MARDRLALGMELSYWGVVAVASTGAFWWGFQWTHQATVSVHVKQPAAGQMEPLPARSAPPPKASPKPGPLGAVVASGPAQAALKPSPAAFPAFPSPSPKDPTLQEGGGAAGASGVFKVQVPGFASRSAAEAASQELQGAGFHAVVVDEVGGGYALQVGAFGDKARAEALAAQVNARGYQVTLR